MVKLKEKLVISGFKLRQFQANTKKMLKNEKGSAVNYILLLAIGLIVIGVLMWPILEDVTLDLLEDFETWWDTLSDGIFGTTSPSPIS